MYGSERRQEQKKNSKHFIDAQQSESNKFGTMFPLIDGKLFRINKDGMNGDPIQVNKPQLEFGTSPLYDYHIKDIDPANELACVIITDELGRVSFSNLFSNRKYHKQRFVEIKNELKKIVHLYSIVLCLCLVLKHVCACFVCSTDPNRQQIGG